MSWGSRFGGLMSGRFSPFGRPGQQAQEVTEDDYSYITSDDLNQQKEADSHRPRRHRDRPAKDTDLVVFRRNKTSYPVHFGAYTIDDGELTVGMARKEAAKKLEVRDPRRIRMFHKGRNLKDDSRPCCDEGMRSSDSTDILCVVGDEKFDEDDGTGSDSDDGLDSGRGEGGERSGKKKRRNRKKKSKRTSGSGSASPIVEHLPVPSGLHPLHREQQNGGPSSGSTPARAPSPAPKTPQGKIQELQDKLREEFVPKCESYMANPPADKAKRDFDHKRLTETILTQVLMKFDAIETEDPDARAMRKSAIKETQGWLNKLDDFNK